jgi:peptidoglycan/xylan/chitin deacetylase (PgdA/CDA1 family)
MRALVALLGTLLFCLASPLAAQTLPQQCAANNALGVSRTVEIDATTGPRFGHLQYRDYDFLQDGEIVLTFDDGPLRSHTLAVLDALTAHCTKATFFSVGRMALADPETLKEVARRGHTIGSHTWSHRNLRAMVAPQAKDELELGLSAVRRALGGLPVAPFFRFPYLSDSKPMLAHLESRGIAAFSIDVDAYDYRTHDPAVVQRNILKQLSEKHKGIILFHDIQPATSRALMGLLDELKARGFRVVHLIPKAPAQTLPEYDEMAERAFTNKRVAAASNPLAKRSVVWPLTPDPAPQQAGATGVPPPVSPVPPASRSTKPEDEDSWRVRVFKH